MSLLKDIVAKGIYYNSIGIKDYMTWSEMMIDYFGPEIKHFMRDIRKWSVTIPSSANNNVSKLNCWEFMGCGLQRNGSLLNAKTTDMCHALIEKNLDGIHGGKNAGRACWVVSHTMCCRTIQETYEQKYKTCVICDFYRSVKEEEESNFISPHVLKKML